MTLTIGDWVKPPSDLESALWMRHLYPSQVASIEDGYAHLESKRRYRLDEAIQHLKQPPAEEMLWAIDQHLPYIQEAIKGWPYPFPCYTRPVLHDDYKGVFRRDWPCVWTHNNVRIAQTQRYEQAVAMANALNTIPIWYADILMWQTYLKADMLPLIKQDLMARQSRVFPITEDPEAKWNYPMESFMWKANSEAVETPAISSGSYIVCEARDLVQADKLIAMLNSYEMLKQLWAYIEREALCNT